MRRAMSVANEVFRLFTTSVAWARLQEVSTGAVIHLRNGYGVSVAGPYYPGDEFPEIRTVREGSTSGVYVEVSSGRSTDPTGILRNCTPQEIINILCVLNKREA